MAKAVVTIYEKAVMARVEAATQAALEALAFQVEAQTKVIIQQNGQIDTGFMLNSVYVLLASGQQGVQWPSGYYPSRNESGVVSRTLAQTAELGDYAAAVGVGAAYAIFQEMKNSFLFRAMGQVSRTAKGTLEPVYRRLI